MNSDGEKDIVFLNDIIKKIEIANVTSNPKELNEYVDIICNVGLHFKEEKDVFYFTKQGCLDTYIYLNLLNDSIKTGVIWSYDYIPIYRKGNNLIYFNNSSGNFGSIYSEILDYIKDKFNERKYGYDYQKECAKSIRENYLYTNMNDKGHIGRLMSSKKKLCEETAFYTLLTASTFYITSMFVGFALGYYFSSNNSK